MYLWVAFAAFDITSHFRRPEQQLFLHLRVRPALLSIPYLCGVNGVSGTAKIQRRSEQ